MSGGQITAHKKRPQTRAFRTDDKMHPGAPCIRVDLYIKYAGTWAA